MANCYDSFIKIGILIEMIKKINYPIDTDKYKDSEKIEKKYF